MKYIFIVNFALNCWQVMSNVWIYYNFKWPSGLVNILRKTLVLIRLTVRSMWMQLVTQALYSMMSVITIPLGSRDPTNIRDVPVECSDRVHGTLGVLSHPCVKVFLWSRQSKFLSLNVLKIWLHTFLVHTLWKPATYAQNYGAEYWILWLSDIVSQVLEGFGHRYR